MRVGNEQRMGIDIYGTCSEKVRGEIISDFKVTVQSHLYLYSGFGHPKPPKVTH